MEKNGAQIRGFVVVKKTPSPWNKSFSKKKEDLPAIPCGYDLQNGVQNFFKIMVLEIFKFQWF